MRFWAFFGVCAAVVGAFVVYAFTWAEQPGDPRIELPPHVTRIAFGLEQWPVREEEGCEWPLLIESEPASGRSIQLVDLTFVGEGDWDIGATLLRRRVRELHVCYGADADETVEVRLRDWAGPEVLADDSTRAACIQEKLEDWSWPQDLQGRVRLQVRAGHMI